MAMAMTAAIVFLGHACKKVKKFPLCKDLYIQVTYILSMIREEFLKKYTSAPLGTGRQRFIKIFTENRELLFDKEELMDKSGLKKDTLNRYLKWLKKEGIIDSINHSLFNNATMTGRKYYFYGNKEFIAKIKENPKEWEI